MHEQQARQLLDKYLSGKASAQETAQLERFYYEQTGSKQLPEIPVDLSRIKSQSWETVRQRTIGQPAKVKHLWLRIAVAASVLIMLGIAALFLSKTKQPQQLADNDVAPGTQMAILKSHGRTIKLDSAKNGIIVSQANATITKSAGEQLAYTGSQETTAVYDTIEIPAGGRPYTVKLSDGSKITLNAATALRYPESFSKTNRQQVELISGEIYASIIHNPDAPLQIKAPGQLITDIGTKFDLSAYADEADSRTTLIEGSVKVSAKTAVTLKPGQQAILKDNSLAVQPADIDEATAWLQGEFSFNGQHIDAIMRQLARWYNIEVTYEGKMTSEVFYGRITRKKNISAVLHMLEKTQKLKFKVEGRRVTVLSKS